MSERSSLLSLKMKRERVKEWGITGVKNGVKNCEREMGISGSKMRCY
jgi:hypothetical protein